MPLESKQLSIRTSPLSNWMKRWCKSEYSRAWLLNQIEWSRKILWCAEVSLRTWKKRSKLRWVI